MLVCSGCSVIFNVNPDVKRESTEPDKTIKIHDHGNISSYGSNTDASEAFYGVWCYGSKNESDAEKFALELSNKGFESQVFVTTDWENLNTEKFYVVTAGICVTKQDAEQLLDEVKKSGYNDAYVKYTGERK